MSELSLETREEAGDVVLRVAGCLPPGSAGNADAARIVRALDEALARRPAGVCVLDLRALDYVSGDALGAAFLRAERAPLRFLLPRAAEPAYRGLLSQVDPAWEEHHGGAVRFV